MNSIAFFRRVGLGVMLAGALAACNDDDGLPVVVATNDVLVLRAGQTAQLLSNDTYNGQGVTAGGGGNVIFAVVAPTLPTGITFTNGVVSVGATANPGTFTVPYRICASVINEICSTATAQITVPAPAIVAVNDSFTLASGSSGDVLLNDTLGGAPATAATVTVSATGTVPAGITLSAAGMLSVGPTAAAGTYAVTYSICQTVFLSSCATATATVTVPAAGGSSISGRAVDSATALGIPNVTVTVGSLTATTDASGGFSLAGVTPGSRVNVLFTVATHSETVRIANVGTTGTTDVQARMVRFGAQTDVAISAGGSVAIAGSPAQVVLPADAVQRADGSIPTGNVRVNLTALNPAADSTLMPGDFTTMVAGAATPIESFGAINVDLRDSAGAALNLRTGQTATIRIPVSSRNGSPPATIPLYWFNNTTGVWVEEGTATLNAGGTYYEGTVTHFTTWNADQVYLTTQVTGCVVKSNGERVANAQVSSDGINYTGTSSAVTDSSGNFTIPMRRGSQATLVALGGGLLSNTATAGAYSTATASLTPCLTLGETGAGITMKLTWGAAPRDLDSHLLTPSGAHVYYSTRGSLTSAPFANLDVDDTTSFGPEVVTISKLMVGTYKYYVLNFSGQSAGTIGASGARVELNVPGRAPELFTPPTTGETSSTTIWQLFEIDVDSACTVTVRRVGTLSGSAPSSPASSAPVYCTAP